MSLFLTTTRTSSLKIKPRAPQNTTEPLSVEQALANCGKLMDRSINQASKSPAKPLALRFACS